MLAGVAALSLSAPLAAACGAIGGEKGGEGGGETGLAIFADTANRISIGYPSAWRKTSDQPLTFTGQDEFIAVEVRPRATDPLAAAKADQSAVQANSPGFALVSLAASTEVKNASVMSYTWELPKSSVTGKPVPERADRYYIDLGDGRMAVVTGSYPKATFDREQVRDIALTLKATK